MLEEKDIIKENSSKLVKHWQWVNVLLIVYDIFSVNIAFFLGLFIRFDCRFSLIPSHYLNSYLKIAPIYTLFCLVVFFIFRLYNSIWRFASFNELIRIIYATIITGAFQVFYSLIFVRRMPITYYAFGIMIQFFLLVAIRFSYRFVLLERSRFSKNRDKKICRVMLIGAGAAGQMILRDIATSKETNDKVFCIIDDNSNKWGREIDGIRIVGGRDKIIESVKKYNIDKIYLAIPTIKASDRKDILEICKDTGCELKNLPGMYQLVNGEVSVSTMRNVDIVDLLGREPIKVDMNEIFDSIKGKVILVTGGGGSIGSELCRQIASHNPKKLIIFDIYENNAYDIEQELRADYPSLDLEVLIGSVRDYNRLDEVFNKFRPNLVYHAAAHKHVPLMEDSPKEAIKNNVFGTYNCCYISLKYNVEKFVMISTDKAVNPTNVMGASKRICEMITQVFDKMISQNKVSSIPNYENENDTIISSNKTCFVAVRFGNVLGSNGSVIPKFRKQIENGGPVTVTHPDIIRYFMTIQEAVSLVLQAGVYAKDGEIFVFDMGTPVKIDTLARNLIKLSGFKPDVDIKIEYTGLRPGEKLYEEKLMLEEGLTKTKNELIHIGKPIDIDTDTFFNKLKSLHSIYNENISDDEIIKLIEDIAPTFVPVGHDGQMKKTDTYYAQLKDAS